MCNLPRQLKIQASVRSFPQYAPTGWRDFLLICAVTDHRALIDKARPILGYTIVGVLAHGRLVPANNWPECLL